MRTPWILLACLALTPVAAGCSGLATDACDLACDCGNCSDREYDECLLDFEAAEETAAVYGCDLEYEDYSICVIDEYRCTAGFFGPDPTDLLACASDLSDYDNCIRDGSRLR